MDNLNIAGLKRNPDAIKSAFKKVGDSLIVTKNLRVIYPDRYNNIGLSILGSTVRIISIFAIVDDNGNYAVANLPIFLDLTPTNVSEIAVGANINKVLHFEEGSVYTENSNLVIDDRFLYDIFNEFYIGGKIPWFMNYDDAISMLARTNKYAGSTLGDNPITMEILGAVIARFNKDKKVFYRQTDMKQNPDFVGLMNIYFTFDNTVSKIAGSYMSQGITSAIINKEDETTKIEEVLRA